ncbi:MAG: hypothetical protein MJ240_11020 [Kiritimatiellae bacterium]|nr:hypothetical protein [Kiritimatiellia bacterium]
MAIMFFPALFAVAYGIASAGGVPRLAVDGQPVVGMTALPSPHAPNAAVTDVMRDFAAAGVEFFCNIWWARSAKNDWWLGEHRYDFDVFDARARALLDASPRGRMLFRLKMDPPDWWFSQNPEEMRGDEVNPASAKWRELRRGMLEDVVRHVEASDYADRVAGYHLGAMHGSEWMVFPTPKGEIPKDDEVAWIAYLARRRNDVADALLDAAAQVKRLTARRKLVGVFYGYDSIPDHAAVARALRSPDVDIFTAPPAYGSRRGGEPAHFQSSLQGSYRLHGKVFFEEGDIRTWLFPNANVRYRCADVPESLGAIRRSIGYALAGGWEVWWFLLAGNDTFRDPRIMETIRVGLAEQRATFAAAKKPAQVAVFHHAAEPWTTTSTRYSDFRTRLVAFNRLVLPTVGIDYDTYELEDLLNPNLPAGIKVYVFPNAFQLTDDLAKKIAELEADPGKIVVRTPLGGQLPTAQELRETARRAGVHVWLDSGDIIAAGRGYLMVHAASDGEKKIALPGRFSVDEIYGQTQPKTNVTALVETFRKGETHIYRLGTAGSEIPSMIISPNKDSK